MGILKARLRWLACGTVLAVLLPGATFRGAVTVRMTSEHAFLPQAVTVGVGDEVIWKNDDRDVHSVVGDPLLALHRIDVEPPAPPEPFHSEDIPPGGIYSRKFTMEGVYRYVCLHHEEQGMNGTVIVGPGR